MDKFEVFCGSVECLYNSSQYGGLKTYCMFKEGLELVKSSMGENMLICKWYQKRKREHKLG